VAENVAFGPKQRGEQIIVDKISELLGEVGLGGYESRDVSKLSGGEAQRVSLARALANSPRVLLLDEPTSALDDASKSGIESLMTRIVKDKQLACLLVTHDHGQAERMANRILYMDRGRVSEQKP
jgi:putative ABC transport system ATP-binding protein